MHANPQFVPRPRKQLIIKVVLSLAAAGVGIAMLNSLNSGGEATAANLQAQVSSQDLRLALHRAGLDARSLTAAAVSSNSVSSVINAAREELGTVAASLNSADASFVQARQQVETLERRIQGGQGSAEDVTALAAARSSQTSAAASRQSALSSLFNAGTAGLSQTQRTVLTNTRANAQWEVPVEYLTVTRTESQWVALREALANERIALAHNESPASAAQTLLQEVRSNLSVAAAITSLAANHTTVNAAWQQASTINP